MSRVPARIAITAVAVGAAASLVAGPSALAEPAQPPAHCTAADLAGVAAGVSASTSAYLFTHPTVNDFFTSLHPVPDADKQAKIDEYFAANPQTADEVKAIRKPLQDVKIRCGDTNGDGIVDIL
ncbi:heme-binding protein [Mycolicibacterium neoaurum]|uniref:heme-binding protein n=1 Tax=Mycolicibacterium neoaurum TaxID=1795 RepID=UPI003B00EBE2